MEDMEENPYYINQKQLSEEEQADELYFQIDCKIMFHNYDYDRNKEDDEDIIYQLKYTVMDYNTILYSNAYSNKYNDHIMWLIIRNMCDINSLTVLIPRFYKETIEIDISNNIWPAHLYNNGTLYIKHGIQEIIQWNYFLITNRIYNEIHNITDRLQNYLLDLLDKYCALFDITYTKCSVDEWIYGLASVQKKFASEQSSEPILGQVCKHTWTKN